MYQGFAPTQSVEQHPHRQAVWAMWDAQTNDKQVAFIELNNLYLAVERGTVALTIHTSNTLRTLVGKIYPAFRGNDFIRDYWQEEFTKLPNWNNV